MAMHRTQIYLQDGLYKKLRARSRSAGVSISELIRQSVEKDLWQSPGDAARAFFERLEPLESFANEDSVTYVRKLRGTSRILRDKKFDE